MKTIECPSCHSTKVHQCHTSTHRQAQPGIWGLCEDCLMEWLIKPCECNICIQLDKKIKEKYNAITP